jgi:hypothetical protein
MNLKKVRHSVFANQEEESTPSVRLMALIREQSANQKLCSRKSIGDKSLYHSLNRPGYNGMAWLTAWLTGL